MIDYIKIIRLSVDIEDLLNNSLLNFVTKTSFSTGEVYENESLVAEYKGLKFVIKYNSIGNRYVSLSGSLHKYGNDGKHNHDQYNYIKLCQDIYSLQILFNINLSKSTLNNLEFGVNINLPFDPNNFLYNIIDHKGQRFNKEKTKDKYYIYSEHSNYKIKIYNKGLQNNLSINLLRFEIHCNRMYHLKDTNIKTLMDLTDKTKLSKLGLILMKHFDELLINDEIDSDNMSRLDKQLLTNGTSHYYWDKLKTTHPFNYPKRRNKFKLLIDQFGIHEYRDTICKKTKKTWEKLLFPKVEKIEELTILEKHYFTGINNWYNQLNKVKNNKSYPRYCQVTDIDISHQKPISKCISENTVRFIYFTNKPLFEELLKKFSSSSNTNKSPEEVCYYIAHNIRNAIGTYNKKKKRIDRKESINLSLFEKEYLDKIPIKEEDYFKKITVFN